MSRVITLLIASFTFTLSFASTSTVYNHAKSLATKVVERFGSEAIVGNWLNEEKTVKVKMEKMGAKYYGKIIWLEKPNESDGSPKKDKYNPDPALRTVPFIGLRIVKDLEYKGSDTWGGGNLYDPEHGKTYGCKITMEDPDVAIIRGYIGFTFIGKSVKFSRTN